MKVKEIDRTANIAWSPATQHPIYLAAGTAAQQLDATFSTNAALEIYTLNPSEPGLQMELAGSIPSDFRFHKLSWGGYGMDQEDGSAPSGMLVGGADNGNLFIWNPAKLLNKEEALVDKLQKHTGAVAALDFNTFQKNLLASGASDSEIYIWDLNNPTKPMTPGAKSQPPDDVTCLSWNKQVQHILASTYAGRCVVWDLRKNEPIIKISDSMSRIKCKLVAWHPEVATQLCLTSEDDHTPVIQLWDLRFATSPLKTLENHQRGILSIAWCPQDPDLLLTCGKDNRILCWNPNTSSQTGEVVYELPTSNQWCFDVQWCPRNPAVISSCSFDGHISIYSLMGGVQEEQAQASQQVADSFPADPFAQVGRAAQPTQQQPKIALSKAPKWLRRPVGASFGFGGKLVTFEHAKAQPNQPAQHGVQRSVHISQVVTEHDLVSRSNQLESALANQQYAEFCNLKIANSKDPMEENMWNFLKVNFEKEPRTRYLQLLGYDQNELSKKVAESISEGQGEPLETDTADELSQKLEELSTESVSSAASDGASAFDQIAATEQETVDADAPLPIAVGNDTDGLITQAILTANFESAVEMCLHDDRMAEAIILAIAGGPELLARTQKKFFSKNRNNLTRLISGVVTRNFESIIRTCNLDQWKEALALVLTYAKPEEFSNLCDILGSRLEQEQNGRLAANAMLCHVCAGNVIRLVDCLSKHTDKNSSPEALQDLVEKVMLLQKSVELVQGQERQITDGLLASKLSQYAELLAAQGSMKSALTYLGTSTEYQLTVMRYRLWQALGNDAPQGSRAPAYPFQAVNVQPEGTAQPKQAVPQHLQQQRQQQSSAQTPRQYQFHQTQAGNFQTTTSPSSSYPTQNQYPPYTSMAGPTSVSQQPEYYTPPQPVSSAAPAGISKGPLSQKYPSYPATSNVYDPYSTTGVSQAQVYNPAMYPTSQASSYGGDQQILNPAVSMHQQTPGAPYMPTSMGDGTVSFQEQKPQNAWNDPPIVSGKSKKQAEPPKYEPQAPITQPIIGVPQEQAPPGAPNYNNQFYNPQQHQPAPEQQPTPAPAPVKKEPKLKAPIPEEFKTLHEVFDKLAKSCLAKAGSPVMKRKLEDVLKKLETLYDKLRENALSQNVTMGLQQIIQCIQAFDYQTGLAYHTQMISQGNFSEISSFMPGIKVLLQTAAHLQVYVQ